MARNNRNNKKSGEKSDWLEALNDETILDRLAAKVSKIIIRELKEQYDERILKLEEKVSESEKEIGELTQKVESLLNTKDRYEQQARRNYVKIQGIKDDDEEEDLIKTLACTLRQRPYS